MSDPHNPFMPIYEYQCKKCGHRFEKIQKFSDAPVKKCPDCGGKVEQLLSAPAVQFKGSGWYVTDYARKSAGGKSGESGDGGGTKSNAEASSDGKPAATEGKAGSPDKSES